jgi:hypothetical protein
MSTDKSMNAQPDLFDLPAATAPTAVVQVVEVADKVAAKPRRRVAPAPMPDLLPVSPPGLDLSLKVPAPALPQTMAALLQHVEAWPPSQNRSDVASAIRTFGKVVGLPLAMLSCVPAKVAAKMASSNPMAAGILVPRWSRVRTHIQKALRDAGYDVIALRKPRQASQAWDAVMAQITETKTRNGSSRLITFFVERGIEPEQVSQASFEIFREVLFTESLLAKPDDAYRKAVKAWNNAASTVTGWPAVIIELAPDTRRYSLAVADLPPPFVEDLEAYCAPRKTDHPFSRNYRKPVRASTMKGRRRHLIQVASALLASGFPAEKLVGLATLVDLDNAEAALTHLLERNKGLGNSQLVAQAVTLYGVAKTYVEAPTENLEVLGGFISGLRGTEGGAPHRGMAPKVAARLRQFELDANLLKLLLLPSRVLNEAKRVPHDAHVARRVMMAMAVEFLIFDPLRMLNLAALDITRHFQVVRSGAQTAVHVVVPAGEMKGDKRFELPLAPSAAKLMATYCDKYRTLVIDGADQTTILFPGRDGKARSPSALGSAITKFVLKETGLVMNPHLFRQLAATLVMKHTAGGLETARLLLGHADQATTSKHYVQVNTDKAYVSLEATILKLIAEGQDQRRKNAPKVAKMGVALDA